MSYPPPPPPPGPDEPGWGTGGYEPGDPYGGQGDWGGHGGQGGPGYGYGGPHPDGTNLLIVAIIGLICCAPINIWVLIKSNDLLKNRGAYDVSKVKTARIIAIISLVIWGLGLVGNIGWMTATTGVSF